MKLWNLGDYPRELIVNGDQWELKFRREIGTKHYDILGDCDYYNRLIQIQLKQTKLDRWVTFTHESLHALFPWLSEAEVRKMEKPLAMFILDNL